MEEALNWLTEKQEEHEWGQIEDILDYVQIKSGKFRKTELKFSIRLKQYDKGMCNYWYKLWMCKRF